MSDSLSDLVSGGVPTPPLLGYPGWKFWAFLVAFFGLIIVGIVLFYHP